MVMIMNRGILLTVCIFAIVVLVVVAGFFLLDIEKVALSYWGFGSLLFSLAVSMLAAITILLPSVGMLFFTHLVFFQTDI